MNTQELPVKAAKILSVAEDLFIKQGFKGVTMSAVARRAHVGKGTTYLYWKTKEDLFLELFSRHLSDTLADLADQIKQRAELAMPHKLLPLLAKTWLEKPIIRTLQSADEETLGALMDNLKFRELLKKHGSRAIIERLVPVWDRHGIFAVDWSEDQKKNGVELLLGGFFSRQLQLLAHAEDTDKESTEILELAILSMLNVTPTSISANTLAADICAELTNQADQLVAQ